MLFQKFEVDNQPMDSKEDISPADDDETEGFASGQEEAFETVLDDNLVLETETLVNVVDDDDDDEDVLLFGGVEDNSDVVKTHEFDESGSVNNEKVLEEDSIVDGVAVVVVTKTNVETVELGDSAGDVAVVTDETDKLNSVLEEVVNKEEVVGVVTDGKFSPLNVEMEQIESSEKSNPADEIQETEILGRDVLDYGVENRVNDKELETGSSQDRSQMIDVFIATDSAEEDGKELFDSSALAETSFLTEEEEEERKKLEKLQSIRVKFLRLVQKLGLSIQDSAAAHVLYSLEVIAGRQTGQLFSLEAAKRKATELESDQNEDLDFSVNILVIGKCGAGKSSTINSIFGEDKTVISAFQPATDSVKEINGVVNGVNFRVFDTPGLRSSVMEQGFNRSVLSSAKKFTKKNPPDIVLYVDRLDSQTRDHNDIPLLKTITASLGSSIWRSAIVTLTHGSSDPPAGSNGFPLSYETFVTQRSHLVQQAIVQAVGDLRMMSPSLMNPVSLVENHCACCTDLDGQKVLPNGQTWRLQLLMLCYSMKISAEANELIKPHVLYENNRRLLFGFRVRPPPLTYMLSSMLQSRPHRKLSSGNVGDSDVDFSELTDSDNEQDEDEYDYHGVKLLQKKQFKRNEKEMKKKGKDSVNEQVYQEDEDAPVPLPDMALPPSFDSDNPAYRFRFLEPTSQSLARPVLDMHGWDHDCGYDGVNLEQTFAIANRFPGSVTVQITKDKKDYSINLDSSVLVKHGENVSTMAGFDVQPIGKQLSYIVRGETKFKNLKKKNKTGAGISVTFLGKNVVTGFKVEDQITFGKQYSIIGSAGMFPFPSDSAYGVNVEMIQRREVDYPIGQIQSTLGLSMIKWSGDLALGFIGLAQFCVGRGSKVAIQAGINNKMSGQITVKTSSSEHLVIAVVAVIPSVISAFKKLWVDAGEKRIKEGSNVRRR
ncbi:translocase of chloroplast 159, chloroplastic-like isoform X2 [Rutidosis leptorrhynchoides]|uniref:translocase of chloroplast 159, chloroplastic-like isoform X2 n=1 Tax=Rutidosis leptorrhynchoides TaxID=125765 RepID=UPI003A99BDE4